MQEPLCTLRRFHGVTLLLKHSLGASAYVGAEWFCVKADTHEEMKSWIKAFLSAIEQNRIDIQKNRVDSHKKKVGLAVAGLTTASLRFS